ncbi:MAG: hypothetical protein LKJ88_01045 [Bacilli bacterium]|jgi:hypothetical protein|nr:hypothetical protein [Bacilli bacterium]
MFQSKTIKWLAYIFTTIACLLYIGVSVTFLSYSIKNGDSFDPETVTAMVLEDCALVLLLLGIFSGKESILVPSIVGGLSWAVANAFISDVSSFKNIQATFNIHWAYGVGMILSLVSDLISSIGIIAFFVELLKRDGASTGRTPFYFFYTYGAVMVMAFVFSVLPIFLGKDDLTMFVNMLLNFLIVSDYVFVIYSFFYKKSKSTPAVVDQGKK